SCRCWVAATQQACQPGGHRRRQPPRAGGCSVEVAERVMSYWACAQLVPQRERLALHCLQKVAGFEVYAPRLRPPRRSKLRVPPLLFPGYTFILVVAGWWAAPWSPGVVRIVLDGGAPARVPDSVISELRSRERNGLVELPERTGFKPG